MARSAVLVTIMTTIIVLPLLVQVSSAEIVDVSKWSGSITLTNAGRLEWIENLGGITNPSFESPLGATPGTGTWHRRFRYLPNLPRISDPIDLNALYYDRSMEKAYHGSYSFKFNFRWYASNDIQYYAGDYFYYYAQLWNTTNPLQSTSGNVKILIWSWIDIDTYNFHASQPIVIYATVWASITYIDTSGVTQTYQMPSELIVAEPNYTSTDWELVEIELTDCRKIINMTLELSLIHI